MSSNEKMEKKDPQVVIHEEPKCYSYFIFITMLIIIALCIILPLGITSNTNKHQTHYSGSDPNSQAIIYYPTSQPNYLYLRHNF